MKLYVLPPSPRALKVIALKNYLGLECEMHIVDLGRGDQLTPEYIAMNPNKKMPVLDDDGHGLLGRWNGVRCDAVGTSVLEVPRDRTLVRQARRVACMAGVDSSAVGAPVIEMSGLEKASRSMSIQRYSLRL
jgi:hypothetical protein